LSYLKEASLAIRSYHIKEVENLKAGIILPYTEQIDAQKNGTVRSLKLGSAINLKISRRK